MIGELVKGAAEKVTGSVTKRIATARATTDLVITGAREMANMAKKGMVDRVTISSQAAIGSVIDVMANGSKKAVITVIDGIALGSKAVANSAVHSLANPIVETAAGGSHSIIGTLTEGAGSAKDVVTGVMTKLQAGSVKNELTAEANKNHVVFGFFNIHIHMR